MRRTGAEARLLAAVAAGHVLKVHRTLDGDKRYRLHRLDGDSDGPVVEEIAEAVIERLLARGLIASNMKFPAATFLLTDAGSVWAAGAGLPAQVRNYAAGADAHFSEEFENN